MSDEIEHDKPDTITRLRARVAELVAALKQYVCYCALHNRGCARFPCGKTARAALIKAGENNDTR